MSGTRACAKCALNAAQQQCTCRHKSKTTTVSTPRSLILPYILHSKVNCWLSYIEQWAKVPPWQGCHPSRIGEPAAQLEGTPVTKSSPCNHSTSLHGLSRLQMQGHSRMSADKTELSGDKVVDAILPPPLLLRLPLLLTELKGLSSRKSPHPLTIKKSVGKS